MAWPVRGGVGPCCDWDGCLAGGLDQAIRFVGQVIYIIDIVRMTYIFVVKNNDKFLFLEKC